MLFSSQRAAALGGRIVLSVYNALSAPCAAFPAYRNDYAAYHFVRRHSNPDADQTETADDSKNIAAQNGTAPHSDNSEISRKFHVARSLQAIDNDEVACSAEFQKDGDKQHLPPQTYDLRTYFRDLRTACEEAESDRTYQKVQTSYAG